MRQNDFSHLRGVIWDLDNTLYRFEGDFEALCHVAAAKAALKGGLQASYNEAFSLCLKSYDVYGHSYRIFIEEHGIAQDQLHYDFHDFIDEKLIRKSLELVAAFERSPLGHVLVTHASRGWAGRALAHIGLKEFFPDEKILPAEDTGFARKSESCAPFEKALELLGVDAENVAVVEDIAVNLRLPYELGMDTVLVHYGQKPSPMPPYVRHDYNNALEFLQAVE